MVDLLILLPLAFVIILNLPFGGLMKKLALPVSVMLFTLQAALVIFFPKYLLAGQQTFFGSASLFNLHVDNLTLVMLLTISIVSLSACLVGWSTISNETKKFDFINLLLLALIGMNGIVAVADLFSLYVYLEITAVASFILISLEKNTNALEGAFKYLMLSFVATILMLSSIALILMLCGDTSFSGVASGLKSSGNNLFLLIAVSIFISGLFIKGGLVPFHGWLPDAYTSAPSGVSVLLAGVVTKSAGIYTLIRLTTSVFGFSESIKSILLLIGAISIVIGALAALGQKDFKRMLAYSSISQVGYIIISLGTGTPLGIAGAVFHLFNHSIFKTQLFVNSAAVEQQAGTRDMDKMGGIASKMPVTGTTSIIAFLSTAGIPPLSGFWSKLIIIIALWSAKYYFYAVLAVLASVITLAYFLSMQRKVFFGKTLEALKNLKEARVGILIPAILLALITIGVGIFFPYILNSFILPVRSILG